MTIHKQVIYYTVWDAPDGGLVCCRMPNCFERFADQRVHRCSVWATGHAHQVHNADAHITIKRVGRLQDADV